MTITAEPCRHDLARSAPAAPGNELRAALEARQFVLHYQPKILLATDRIVGFEALVRWEHPLLGLISPDQFIPLAESTGLIVDLGAWVLEEACRQAQDWRNRLFERPPLTISVNVSARQFQPELVIMVADVLARTVWRLRVFVSRSPRASSWPMWRPPSPYSNS